MLTRHSIFEQMNELGASKVPFFFMIDFFEAEGRSYSIGRFTLGYSIFDACRKKEFTSSRIYISKISHF
jgi:hypothetical protein